MSQSSPEPAKKLPLHLGYVVLIVALPLLLLAYCSATDKTTTSATDVSPVESKYVQTWPKAYSDTTCEDWVGPMTRAQNFAAAADMLTAARNKRDGGAGVPSDALISEFEDGITRACVIPTMVLTDVAVELYLTDHQRFKP